MDTQTRRLSLQTKFTDHRNLEGYPRSAFNVIYSPYSCSPGSPRYSPVNSSNLRGEPVRRPEGSVVDPMGQRRRLEPPLPSQQKRQALPPLQSVIRPISPPSYSPARDRDHVRRLTPDDEHPHEASRPEWPAPSGSLTQARQSAGMPIPRHLSLSQESEPQGRTIVDETRKLLLTGLHPSHMRSIAAVPSPRDRRFSQPSTPLTARRRSYYVARDVRDRRDYLAYGNLEGNPLEADCLVAAFALRQNAGTATRDESKPKSVNKVDGTKSVDEDKGQEKGGEKEKKDKADNHVVIRVRVHPRDTERKPFVMQKKLNVEELRGTIQEPPPTPISGRPPMSARLTVPDRGYRKSVDMQLSAEAETPGLQQSRRASSISSPGQEGDPHTLDRDLFRRAKVVPMHLDIARESLPVLAVLMLTGHIRKGDIIDLPVPHPEVWPQTVAYVYTPERIELTEPMKENILYLGGKVA